MMWAEQTIGAVIENQHLFTQTSVQNLKVEDHTLEHDTTPVQ